MEGNNKWLTVVLPAAARIAVAVLLTVLVQLGLLEAGAVGACLRVVVGTGLFGL